MEEFEDLQVDCITQHPGFLSNCHDPFVLQASYDRFKKLKQETISKLMYCQNICDAILMYCQNICVALFTPLQCWNFMWNELQDY